MFMFLFMFFILVNHFDVRCRVRSVKQKTFSMNTIPIYFRLKNIRIALKKKKLWFTKCNLKLRKHPLFSYPLFSYPILSLLLSFLISFLSYFILSYPFLSYPFISYPVLSYPVLLSYPLPSYPICPSRKQNT